MTLRYKIFVISRELFQVVLVSYLLLTMFETFRPGTASNFFNLNYLLAGALVSGLAMVGAEKDGFSYKLMRNK